MTRLYTRLITSKMTPLIQHLIGLIVGISSTYAFYAKFSSFFADKNAKNRPILSTCSMKGLVCLVWDRKAVLASLLALSTEFFYATLHALVQVHLG